MRKLINPHQENLIECDNVNCDYAITNPTGDPDVDLKEFLGKHCPKCNWPLLTQEDYDSYNKMMRTIRWINKWFSWITVLYPRKGNIETVATVKVHEGTTLKVNDGAENQKVYRR